MSRMRQGVKQKLPGAAALLLCTALLAGCSAGGGSSEPGASGSANYPMQLDSPHGTTTLERKPERVAVLSTVDRDIVLALGMIPVIAPKYATEEGDEPWVDEAIQRNGGGALESYDGDAEQTNYEAIAAAKPDVIVATTGWTLENDYEKLSRIAPIVSYPDVATFTNLSWQERTRIAAKALDLSDKAEQVISDIEAKVTESAEKYSKQLAGKSYTYLTVHPHQLTYESHPGNGMTLFSDIGLELPEFASEFSDERVELSRENIGKIDSDLLLVCYPYEDGILTQEQLESDPGFKAVKAVKNKNYLVVDGVSDFPLAYPSPLNVPWLLDNFVPELAKAAEA